MKQHVCGTKYARTWASINNSAVSLALCFDPGRFPHPFSPTLLMRTAADDTRTGNPDLILETCALVCKVQDIKIIHQSCGGSVPPDHVVFIVIIVFTVAMKDS